jgi:hypothetical protein
MLIINIQNDPQALPLAKLALELTEATANSVPSERAFSTMNFLQTKLRSRMTVENMDMLVFIYMNTRSLRHMEAGQREVDQIWDDEQEEVLLNMEDEMVNGLNEVDFNLENLDEEDF